MSKATRFYVVKRVFALAPSSMWSLLAFGCAPATVDFGELPRAALANVYFEKTGLHSEELGALCADVETVTQDSYDVTDSGGYEAVWVTGGNKLVLRVVRGAQVVSEHSFDRAFLESGAFQRIELTMSDGEQLAYTVWGSSACEACPPYAPGGGETCFPETHTKPGTVSGDTPGVVVDAVELGAPAIGPIE